MIKKFFLGILALVVIGCAVFFACKKEDIKSNEVTKNTVNNSIEKASKTFWLAQWSDDKHKGSGRGNNKICVSGSGRCVLWFRLEKMEESINKGRIGIVVEIKTNGKPAGGGNDNGNWIRLDFRNQYNNPEMMNEIFDLKSKCLIIKEDIVEEEDSELLNMMKTSSTCIIPAGKYPIAIYGGGVTVQLPVVIK
jgi:hypothetical protein